MYHTLNALFLFQTGNTAFGVTLVNPSQFTKTKFVESKADLSRNVNSKEFKHYTELGPDLFEVQSTPRQVCMNIPIQIGFFVLQYAKLRMLQFVYNFIHPFIARDDRQALFCETDSYYVGLSGPSFESVVRPTMVEKYKEMIYDHCTNGQSNPAVSEQFISRECCDACRKWDKRQSGLFKIENTGNELVALSSKSYFLKYETGEKMRCKGVNRNRLPNAHEQFLGVLNDKQTVHVENIGTRAIYHRVYSYKQRKVALNFMYTKRQLLDDFVSTKPLDITLRPDKLVQCEMCESYCGDFEMSTSGSYFCYDCVQFIGLCA